MNKTISFFLLLTFVFVSCKHKNYLNLIENDWKKDKLKGRVKKVVETTYENDVPVSLRVTEYNDKGFIVRKVDSGVNNKWAYVTTYLYDTVANSLITIYVPYKGGEQAEYYKYNRKGNLVEIRRNLGKSTYSYDDKNRVVKEETYPLGSLSESRNWQYKPDGSAVIERIDWPAGRKDAEITKTDSVEIFRSFDESGKVKAIWVDRFDKAGNHVFSEGREYGKLVKSEKNYYNQFNDRVMSITEEKNRVDTVVTEYIYDKTGNWTKIKGSWSREISYW